MCGIYGTNISYSEKILTEKMSAIDFRGPDATGIRRVRDFYFGHRRLSILDLDERSNQPFEYEHTVIVFNGEVFNYNEIKATLIKKGYHFRTESDTEVISAAYLEYGVDCINMFNGMFAFVIYDLKKDMLFGGRDRLGQKPFYYLYQDKKFEFASQIKQIKVGNNLSLDLIAQRFYLEKKHVPAPYSIYKEVKKLRAGHYFTYSISSNQLKISKYWEPHQIDAAKTQHTYSHYKASLNALIDDAVKIRLNTDVPLGLFLSGGVDSSLIAAKAQKLLGGKLNTFSVGFDESSHDESQYAQEISQHLGTKHQLITCSMKEGLDLIPSLPKYFDEPFSDASAIPMSLLSKHASEYVTVALTGDASDESFLGYNRYAAYDFYHHVFKLPRSFRKIFGKILLNAPVAKLNSIGRLLGEKDLMHFYYRSMYNMNSDWLSEELEETPSIVNKVGRLPINKVEKFSYIDLQTYLIDDINVKLDRASMSYSMELRSPLIDHRVVDYAKEIPFEYKIKDGNRKMILKDILSDYIPNYYFDRPKSGFSVPLNVWFRNDLKEFVMDTLNPSVIKKIPNINVHRVTQMIENHMNGKANKGTVLWTLLNYAIWDQEYN